MQQAKIELSVRNPGPGVSAIDIRGDVNGAADEALADAYAEATREGQKKIVLNFANMSYMNSSGIGLLVTLLVRCNRNGQKLFATGLSKHYQHIFKLTRLDEAIRLFDTEAAALQAD